MTATPRFFAANRFATNRSRLARPTPEDSKQPAAAAGRGAWSALRRTWRRLLAASRLSPTAVCQESASLGPYDYHNYRDDVDGATWCAEGGARCKRCGKRFRL